MYPVNLFVIFAAAVAGNIVGGLAWYLYVYFFGW